MIALIGAAGVLSLQNCERDRAIETATGDAPAAIEETGDAINEATDN